MTPPSPGMASPLAATDTAASQPKYGHAMPVIAEPAALASSREHDPARIARGRAALVLAELPRSLAERKLDGNTELTCRIRALTLELPRLGHVFVSDLVGAEGGDEADSRRSPGWGHLSDGSLDGFDAGVVP